MLQNRGPAAVRATRHPRGFFRCLDVFMSTRVDISRNTTYGTIIRVGTYFM